MLGNRDQPSHISQNLTNLTVGSLYYLEYYYAVRQIQPSGSSCVLSVTFGEDLVSSVSLRDTGEGQYGRYRLGARQLHFTTPTAEMKLSVTCESKTTQFQVSLDDITLKTPIGKCPLE